MIEKLISEIKAAYADGNFKKATALTALMAHHLQLEIEFPEVEL